MTKKGRVLKLIDTCSGGLLNAGETEALEETPEPDRISLRIPLIPSSSKVLAPRGDPLAQVERSRIKPCIYPSQGATTTGKMHET